MYTAAAAVAVCVSRSRALCFLHHSTLCFLHHSTLCFLHHSTLCFLHHSTPHHSTLHHSTLHHSTLHQSTLHHSTLHRSTLHHSTLPLDSTMASAAARVLIRRMPAIAVPCSLTAPPSFTAADSEELVSNLASKRCISTTASSTFTRLLTGDGRFSLSLTTNGGLSLVDSLAATTVWSVAGSTQQGAAQLCLLSNGTLLLSGGAVHWHAWCGVPAVHRRYVGWMLLLVLALWHSPRCRYHALTAVPASSRW
jgi:hypothetical protein